MPTVLCRTCGNEFVVEQALCPFCGTVREEQPVVLPAGQVLHRVVNLERGLPLVQTALSRLEQELLAARHGGCKVLTLIHGYGSSGKGGAIRMEVRRQLQYLKQQGKINDLLPGEEFSRNAPHGGHLIRRFPFLRNHQDLNRGNRGITLVVL